MTSLELLAILIPILLFAAFIAALCSKPAEFHGRAGRGEVEFGMRYDRAKKEARPASRRSGRKNG